MIYFLPGHQSLKIHHWLSWVCGDKTMSEISVKDWCTDVHDEGKQGWYLIVMMNWLKNGPSHPSKTSWFQIFEFSQISWSSLFWIVTKCHFRTNVELKDRVKNWLEALAGQFLDEVMQKLVPRYNQLLGLGGDCMEN